MTHSWEINPTAVGKRMEEVRGKRSLESAAEQLGVHKNTLRNYETAVRKPDLDFLLAFCTTHEILPEWLFFGERQTTWKQREVAEGRSTSLADEEEVQGKYVLVPRYEPPFEYRDGRVFSTSPNRHQVAFRKDWIEGTMRLSIDGLIATNITSDTMAPYLLKDDIVLIDQKLGDPLDDGVHAIFNDRRLSLCRVQPSYDGSLLLHSDNPAYDTLHIKAGERERVVIVGRVVWMGRGL